MMEPEEDWESEATVVRSDLSEKLSQHMAQQRAPQPEHAKRDPVGPARPMFVEEATRPMSIQSLGLSQPPQRAETPSDRPTRIMPSFSEPAPAARAPAPPQPKVEVAPPPRPAVSQPPPAPRPVARQEPEPRPSQRPVRGRPVGSGGPAVDDVDSVLSLLQRNRIFEPFMGEAATWVVPTRAERAGSRIGRAVIVVWVLGLIAVGGMYAGYRHHDQQQRSKAASLTARAEVLTRDGEHKGLVEANQLLMRARRLAPRDTHRAEVALVNATLRALEEGDVPAGVLLATVQATTTSRPTPIYADIARAVALWSRNDRAAAVAKVAELEPRVQTNGMQAYLVGRLAQRVGAPKSRELLEKALSLTPDFPPAQLALASADAEEQRVGDAVARVDAVLARHRTHLRARLYRALLGAEETEPDALLAQVQTLDAELRTAGSTDRVLAALVRARAYRRKNDEAAAGRQVDVAVREGGTNPRLLLLVAREAIAIGHLPRAAQAAMAALLLAPHMAEARRTVGEVHVRRRDGLRALDVLGTLPATDVESRPWVARGLLLVAPLVDEARNRALELVTQLSASEDPSERALALRLRVATDPSTGAASLSEAKTLARNAPGVPEVMRAVAEIALLQGDARAAVDAARKLVTAEPRSVEAAIYLGRALRASGTLDEAKATYARAVELDATDPEALLGLADTELALGAFTEADAHYVALTRLNGSTRDGVPNTAGRIGRAEALLGLGRIADARIQLEGVPAADRARPRAQLAAARLALVDGRPGDAVALLRPRAEPENAPLEIIALYGDALMAAGETESAGAQYERVLARDEDHPEALLGAATVLVRGSEYRDAGEMLGRARRALELHPRGDGQYGRLLMLIGRTELEQRNIEPARTFLRQATQREGVPAEAWFHLGESLQGANSPDARAAYERYLSLEPNGPYADRARRAIR